MRGLRAGIFFTPLNSMAILRCIIIVVSLFQTLDAQCEDQYRVRTLIEMQRSAPFPPLNVADIRTRAFSVLNFVQADFFAGKENLTSNTMLSKFLFDVRNQPYYRNKNNSHRENNMADYGIFHFQITQYLFRIKLMFGSNGSKEPNLLSAENAQLIDEILHDWATSECRLIDANVSRVWVIWGSENHSALRDSACWAAAMLSVKNSFLATKIYSDGSSAAQQLEGWQRFIKRYLRERARSGVFVEYFSPTYSQYSLLSIYLYSDFSDDSELRVLAKHSLDVWWALWAQEQINGVHGGSKTRTYAVRVADGTPLPTTAWLYFGLGAAPQKSATGRGRHGRLSIQASHISVPFGYWFRYPRGV